MSPSTEQSVKRGRVWVVVLLVAFFTLCWAFQAWIRPPRIVGKNQAIQYDDFGFEVTDVERMVLDGKPYTVVTLRVHNWAKRVDFQFRRSSALIKDAAGRRFGVSEQGQHVHDAHREVPDPCADPLPAGTSCTTQLVFALPPDTADPRLIISGGWIGDLLDTLLVGRKEIRLTSSGRGG